MRQIFDNSIIRDKKLVTTANYANVISNREYHEIYVLMFLCLNNRESRERIMNYENIELNDAEKIAEQSSLTGTAVQRLVLQLPGRGG